VIIIEALAQAAGILTFLSSDTVPHEDSSVLLRRHRQRAFPQAGRAGRSAHSRGELGSLPARYLAFLHQRRVGSGEVAHAQIMVTPEAGR